VTSKPHRMTPFSFQTVIAREVHNCGKLSLHWQKLQFRRHLLTLISTSCNISVKNVTMRSLTLAAVNKHDEQTDTRQTDKGK